MRCRSLSCKVIAKPHHRRYQGAAEIAELFENLWYRQQGGHDLEGRGFHTGSSSCHGGRTGSSPGSSEATMRARSLHYLQHVGELVAVVSIAFHLVRAAFCPDGAPERVLGPVILVFGALDDRLGEFRVDVAPEVFYLLGSGLRIGVFEFQRSISEDPDQRFHFQPYLSHGPPPLPVPPRMVRIRDRYDCNAVSDTAVRAGAMEKRSAMTGLGFSSFTWVSFLPFVLLLSSMDICGFRVLLDGIAELLLLLVDPAGGCRFQLRQPLLVACDIGDGRFEAVGQVDGVSGNDDGREIVVCLLALELLGEDDALSFSFLPRSASCRLSR